MKICPMQKNHLEAVARLEKECFSQPWSITALEEEIENPTAVFLVAEENGDVLGYAGMHVVCGEGYIDNIAVFNSFRRNGIGKQLVTALIEYMQNNSGLFLTLEVRESNSAAISLYHCLGFCEVGKRPDFYSNPKESAVLMTLNF